jgi:hypothetical protein
VAIHVAACLLLLSVAGGTEIVPDKAERARWVAEHPARWAATWTTWALASLSLLAFVVVWAAHLLEQRTARIGTILACLLCAAGVASDLIGETVNLVGPTAPRATLEDYIHAARLYAILSVAIANGLYCVAGLLLSVIAWRIGSLHGYVGILGFGMWIVGLVLTGMAVAGNEQGMVVTGGAVMVLFIPWAAMVGWRMRAASA